MEAKPQAYVGNARISLPIIAGKGRMPLR